MITRQKQGAAGLMRQGVVAVAAIVGLSAQPAFAKELPEGQIIDKSNYDSIKNDTFENKTIASMVPEKLEWMIKNFGLTIKLGHSKKIEMDPKYVQATKELSKDVKFNPADRTVSGWKAGMLFPPESIKMDDPNAGDKVIWNLRAATYGATMDLRDIAWVFADAKKGYERFQRFQSRRYYMEGRLDGGPVTVGDGTIAQKTYFVATHPQEIRGLGLFSVRYNQADSKKPDDSYAYLKSVRRTRRMSGGAWMDPIGGTDQLYDDWDIWDAAPTKYLKNKLIEKRWVLAIAHSPEMSVDNAVGDDNMPKKYPRINLSEAPYCNPAKDIVWEPREVYVVEGTPPPEHPYSKKVVYMEVDFPRPYLGYAEDRKGEFWKMFVFQNRPDIGDDGYKAVMPVIGHIIDVKRGHCTNWSSNMKSNPKGVKETDVSLNVLEEVATGAK
ncbi:MAG TPA: DUF1329 domain-containing protein [Rhodocyclaceae bacterium]|nr:DUF1329 domain-containing protein [Rhodocyclaceae bacterium]HNA03762.1 DUF1329 domain-containing protein [Rhodocyclaceae bacterium]HNB78010.1 DUF1329 domain-containing protein [Rhodocyclaceae bacterium]HNC62394.1 DUF1329 domain-containing protein [Rhodocyclaceae bacterium]HNH12113.1 DUF1329 domain-containing protein [Rhodocyclaceae bacterium]